MKTFVVLSVFFAVAKCQEKPKVKLRQGFKHICLGDELVLTCSGNGATKWYFKDNQIPDQKAENLLITIKSKDDGGPYACEREGLRSESESVTVDVYSAAADLSIKHGNSVVYRDDPIHLILNVDDKVQDWRCSVFKNGKVFDIFFNSTEESSVEFIPTSLNMADSPAIYWCKHKTSGERSNTVSVRVTDLMVKLVPHPSLPIMGSNVELRCVVYGAPNVMKVIFNKDGMMLQNNEKVSYTIEHIEKNNGGTYSCTATYVFQRSATKIPYSVTSQSQHINAIEAPYKAEISYDSSGLKCSCPTTTCPANYKTLFYKEMQNGRRQHYKDSSYPEMGSYRCRVLWKDGVSLFSNPIEVEDGKDPSKPWIFLIMIIMVLLLIVVFGVVFYCRRRRRQSEALYQEVPLGAVRSEKGEDRAYEGLLKSRTGQGESDYETLKGEGKEGRQETEEDKASGQGSQQEAGYEALKQSKGDEKAGMYHTLGAEGEKGAAAGGYEALKLSKEDEKGGMYHTLGAEGEKGAGGGYEALKASKDEKEGEYQTIGGAAVKGDEDVKN